MNITNHISQIYFIHSPVVSSVLFSIATEGEYLSLAWRRDDNCFFNVPLWGGREMRARDWSSHGRSYMLFTGLLPLLVSTKTAARWWGALFMGLISLYEWMKILILCRQVYWFGTGVLKFYAGVIVRILVQVYGLFDLRK